MFYRVFFNLIFRKGYWYLELRVGFLWLRVIDRDEIFKEFFWMEVEEVRKYYNEKVLGVIFLFFIG